MSDRDGKGQPTERAASLRIHSEEEVCWVTIDRPGDRNALDSDTVAELGEQLARAEGSGARVIIYQGGGDAYFIGGADGVEMFELDPQGAHGFSRRFQGLLDRMEASPLLLIAAIDGLCFGGGLEFALACDLRVATEGSRLGLPEVKLGIIPGGGGTQRLPRVVGFGRAVEMILGGHLVSAREALAMGLVHAVVPDADIGSWARKRAERACALPAFALSAAKRSVYGARDLPLAQGLAREAEEFAACFSEGYFADRVREQLADGRLVTTCTRQPGQEAVHDGDL